LGFPTIKLLIRGKEMEEEKRRERAMKQKYSKETGGQKSMSSNVGRTWIIIRNSILHLPNLGPCVYNIRYLC
jgi:hypothetical protein